MNNEEIKETLSNIIAYLRIDGVELNQAQINFIYSSLLLTYFTGTSEGQNKTTEWNEVEGINRTAEDTI